VEAPFVAFTDDDVLVDRYWLAELIQGFAAAPNVGCVTGMIAPAEIETQAQDWTEQFGFKKGFQRRIFDRQLRPTPSPLYPYTAGTFGSGANMAFRTEALRKMGGFDPALGAGSKALGGDDLAAFFGIIAHGYTLVYEPSAIVYHRHRRDYAGLQQQAFGYGAGLTAYLTHTVLERPGRLWELIARLPYGLYFTFSTQSPHNLKKRAGYPKELTARERRGMLYGPFAYLRSRWHTRQLRNIGPVGGSLWPGAPIRD
jgi:cellulose synthase/poly-beta-1,6-N-acetylglucosamine synthase-like glycosyltransferase